jgi:hypothetical protein
MVDPDRDRLTDNLVMMGKDWGGMLEDLKNGEHPGSPFGPNLSISESAKRLLRALLRETKVDLLSV